MASVGDEVQGPCVFFCRKCKTILGDTYSWIGGEESLKLVCISNAPGAVVDSSSVTHASKGPDAGRCVDYPFHPLISSFLTMHDLY